MNRQPSGTLKRELGVFGATVMGLGSILGTGVFISIGIAAGVTGPSVILAIAVGAMVAICNGLSSAQLAANHAVSGGTYEYAYRWLTPSLGFTAGWMFLCAKSASAATAALGFSGYLLKAIGQEQQISSIIPALSVTVLLAIVVYFGIRKSNVVNIAIVAVAVLSLVYFVVAGLPTAVQAGTQHLSPFFQPLSEDQSSTSNSLQSFMPSFLQACALMFVAYTGYGRIATMAEEVHHPRRTIPVAIIVTLVASMLIYIVVGYVAVASVGSEAFSSSGRSSTAPLETIAEQFSLLGASQVVAIGAMAAMLGVLLNLLLGLSRVVLAMGRKRDLPSLFGDVEETTSTPRAAVILVGAIIAGLVLIGDIKLAWSFSAFTVLIYYAITNLCAIRLTQSERLYPRTISVIGLASCLFLAFWVEPAIWLVGLGLIATGLIWHWTAKRIGK